MDHTVDTKGGITVVRLQGVIDVNEAAALRTLLERDVDSAARGVLVDLSGVRLIDSSGIGVLVSVHRRAAETGMAFGLAACNDSVGRVFELTRTNKLLRIFSTVNVGLEGLADSERG